MTLLLIQVPVQNLEVVKMKILFPLKWSHMPSQVW